MRAVCNDQMHWIGHPSTLVPIQDYGTAPVTDDVSTVINTSMSGARRVRVSRNRPPRSWSLSIPAAKTDDLRHFRTLLTATMPPYVFISADAQVTNALTPEQSTLTAMSNLIGTEGPTLAFGGMWKIIGEDPRRGGALARLNPNASFSRPATVFVGPCPVPPHWTGRSVTVSAYLATAHAGGARASIQWMDANGMQVGTLIDTSPNPVTGMDGLRRSWTTAKPPAGAVSCLIYINYAEVIAQPAVTWTDHLIPEWSVGNGAQYVVISKSGHEAIVSSANECGGIRRANYDIDLIEAGP